MAAHLRPRRKATTPRIGRGQPSKLSPAAGKCSGVLAGPRNFADHGIDKSIQLFKVRCLLWLQEGNNHSELPLAH